MFKKLTQLEYKRTGLEAFGFYLAYLFLFMLVAGLIGVLFARDYSEAVGLGARFAIVISPIISILVLYKKKQLHNFLYLLLIVLAGIIAMFIGMIGGLIPAAYFTTLEPITNAADNINDADNINID